MTNYLFVSEYFYPAVMGGGEINLMEKCKQLIKEGHTVTVLTSAVKYAKWTERINGISVLRTLKTGANPSSIFSNIKRALVFPRSVIKELDGFAEPFDEVHLIGSTLGVADKIKTNNLYCKLDNLMSICPKSDLITYEHECKNYCYPFRFVMCQFQSEYMGKMKNKFYIKYNPLAWYLIWKRHKAMKDNLKHCKVITVSKYMQQLLKERGIESTVEPNIIPEMFKPSDKKRPWGPPRVMAIGSLVPYRGFHILIEALQGLGYELRIYGEGPMKDKLTTMIKHPKYSINGEIMKPVKYEKVPEIMDWADIVVVPSLLPEPEGRVAKEALQMKKHVIVSNIGALGELKRAKKFKPGDVKGLRRMLNERQKN